MPSGTPNFLSFEGRPCRAPLAAFVLGDERLVVAEPPGNLLLGEPMTHAQLAEQLLELFLLRRAQCITAWGGAGTDGSGLSE